MPITMQKDPKQTSTSGRPQPTSKPTSEKPDPKKPIFSDWASI